MVSAITACAFRSPARILIPKLVKSREGWKAKANQRKQQLKAADIRNRDLELSRDKWKERALTAEARVAELEKQLAQTQQELAATRQENAQLLDPKKR